MWVPPVSDLLASFLLSISRQRPSRFGHAIDGGRKQSLALHKPHPFPLLPNIFDGGSERASTVNLEVGDASMASLDDFGSGLEQWLHAMTVIRG